jgi:hypothetical protein
LGTAPRHHSFNFVKAAAKTKIVVNYAESRVSGLTLAAPAYSSTRLLRTWRLPLQQAEEEMLLSGYVLELPVTG